MFLLKSLYFFVRLVKYINFLLYLSLVGLFYGAYGLAGGTVKSIWDLRLIFFLACIIFFIITLFCFLTFKLLKNIKMYIQSKNEFRLSVPLFLSWFVLFFLIYSCSAGWGVGLFVAAHMFIRF